jgi:Protein of unknown function (DUF742)
VDTENDPAPAIGTTGARFGGAPRRRRAARQRAAEAAAAPAEPLDPPAPREDTAAIPVGPMAAAGPGPSPGAGPPGPNRPGTRHPAARQYGAPDAAGPGPPVGTVPSDAGWHGAMRPGTAHARAGQAWAGQPAAGQPGEVYPDVVPLGVEGSGAVAASQPELPAPAVGASGPNDPRPPRTVAPLVPPVPDEPEPAAGGSAFVRPYVLTRGRTRSSFELSIETLVSAGPRTAPAGLTGEHQVVLSLCRQPRSVAELAALAGVPLGVARVLVGDLAAASAVAVNRGAGAAGPDLALMQRVLSGLRRL